MDSLRRRQETVLWTPYGEDGRQSYGLLTERTVLWTPYGEDSPMDSLRRRQETGSASGEIRGTRDEG